MNDALRATVSAAAAGTMCGGARVRLMVRTSVPEFDARLEYRGVVDFDNDRCRLDGHSYVADELAPSSMILDGSTTYTREADGGWTFTSGPIGTRGMLHPSGLLDALVRAATSARRSADGSVVVGLDYEVLNACADAGLAPDWASTAVAWLPATGRIRRVVLTHRSREDPDAFTQLECEISEAAQVGPIDLPPEEETISLAAKIEQQHADSGA